MLTVTGPPGVTGVSRLIMRYATGPQSTAGCWAPVQARAPSGRQGGFMEQAVHYARHRRLARLLADAFPLTLDRRDRRPPRVRDPRAGLARDGLPQDVHVRPGELASKLPVI